MFAKGLALPRYKKNVLYVVCATIHLALFHSLRNPYVYPDNLIYGTFYYEIPAYTLKELLIGSMGWEKGYVIYNYLLAQVFPSPEALFITTSLFMTCGFMYLVYKWSYKPWLSVLIYILHPMLFYTSLFVLRQHIAMIFILFALFYVNDFRKSIPLAVLGVLFHNSALLFFPFLIWNRINLRTLTLKKLLIYGGGCVLFIRFSLVTIAMLISRYVHYLEKGSSNILPFMIISTLFFLHFILGSFKKATDEKDIILFKFLSYGLIIVTCTLGLPFGRLTSYFIYIVPFLVPLLFKYGKTKNVKVIVLYILLLFFLLMVNIYISFSPNSAFTLEYKFYWE